MYKPIALVSLVSLLALFGRLVVLDRRFLHIFQLEGYKNGRFLVWSGNNYWRLIPKRELLIDLCFGAGSLVLLFQLTQAEGSLLLLASYFVAWCGANIYNFLKQPKKKEKKPLRFTARAIRIFSVSLLVQIIFALGAAWFAFNRHLHVEKNGLAGGIATHNEWIIRSALLIAVGAIILKCGTPFFLVAANTLLAPIQMSINQFYLGSARRKLDKIHPTVVGITGSYGKTSTKFILEAVLSAQFNVLKTPESYNTMLGISRVINQMLSEDHQVLVVEMGAFGPGEIKESCDLVHPSTGIITAIGPQHLERFGSIDKIVATKYELIEALPKHGVAVFNADDERCWNLAARTRPKMNVFTFGVHNSQADVLATDIRTGASGLRFTVQLAEGEKQEVRTRLLGRPNVYNILAATTAALQLGLSLEAITRRLSALRPVPHRLELKRLNGLVVIDDAYNSNPEGARAALEVLAEMEGARKILVTPGMIELGEMESSLNQRFGELAATVCDIVFLVGPARTFPILQGLKQKGFQADRVRVVNSLQEVMEDLRRAARPGDVVLMENDLPDTYEY
jgi:UDP-N-acetylmuramoyl-tripeptide--D-alanyl-D-alanine ligase